MNIYANWVSIDELDMVNKLDLLSYVSSNYKSRIYDTL